MNINEFIESEVKEFFGETKEYTPKHRRMIEIINLVKSIVSRIAGAEPYTHKTRKADTLFHDKNKKQHTKL
jgi:hypothetical protein